MKIKFLAVITVLVLALSSLVACDIGLKDKEYEATDDIYFEFVLREDGESYAISKKAGAALPERIKLPAEHTEGEVTYPVVEVLEEGFIGEGALKSVIIPAGYEIIGVYAFVSCSIETLEIGAIQGVRTADLTVKYGAFQDCTNLATVRLGESVKVVSDYAFYNTKVSSVYLTKVEKIGYRSFGNCISLSSFYVPTSLVEIADHAFEGSENVRFTVSEGNPVYGIEDGKLIKK